MARARPVERELWYWLKKYKAGEPIPDEKANWCSMFLEGARVANLQRFEDGQERARHIARRIAFKEVMEDKTDQQIADDFGITISAIRTFRRRRKDALSLAYAWVEQLLMDTGSRARAKTRARMLARIDVANERYDEVLYDAETSPALKFRVAKDVLDRVDPPTKKVEHSGDRGVRTLNVKTLNLIQQSVERGEKVPELEAEAEWVEQETLEAGEEEEEEEIPLDPGELQEIEAEREAVNDG